MKKLKKLSLAKLAQEHVALSTKEQMQIYAGSGIDGLCYFDGLEILSNKLGCNYDEGYYVVNYAASHGGFSSIYDSSTGTFLGVQPSNALSYLQDQFTGHNVSVADYQSSLAQGGYIMTDINQGNETSHAVVVISYYASQGYRCQDANRIFYSSAASLNSSFSYNVTSGAGSL